MYYMYEEFDEPVVNLGPQQFMAEDWLEPRNLRDIIHIGRNTLLKEVRAKLDVIRPTLISQGGFAYYHSYVNDAEHRVLINSRQDSAGELCTLIITNTITCAQPGDANFPDGRSIQLTDVIVPNRTKWLNTAWEHMQRFTQDKAWSTPLFATLLEPNNDSIRLIGNARKNKNFVPLRARDRQEVADDANALWTTLGALSLCSPTTLEEWVTKFRN